MSREEVELVRRMLDGMGSNDPAGLETLAPEVEFVNHAGPEKWVSGRKGCLAG